MSTPIDPHLPAAGDSCTAEVTALVTALEKALAAGIPAVDESLRADLTALLPLRARLDALVAERLAAFDRRDLAQDDGASSATSWVTARCNVSGGEAASLLATGRRMSRFSALGELLAAGAVSTRHARIVERCVTGLPERFVEPAVEFLTPLAAEHEPRSFGFIAQQLRETLTPELTDCETTDLLDSQWLDVSPFDGGLRVDGMLRGLNAEAFATALRRFSVPKPHDERPAKLRRADALGELARVASEAPAGGLAPVQVTVICDLPTLERAHQATRPSTDRAPCAAAAAGTDRFPRSPGDLTRGAYGELTRTPVDWAALIGAVTCGDTRRLVLGPESEVLDLGRKHRFFTRAQRIAIRRGDQRCRVRGCRSPYVEYDHKTGWGEGGSTDVRNGRALCTFHNLLRTRGWDLAEVDGGEVRLIRPADWHLRRHRRRRPQIE